MSKSAGHEAVIAVMNRRLGLSGSGAFAREHGAELRPVIDQAMRHAGMSTPFELAAALETDQWSMDDLVEGLTVRETYFFRHAAQFDLVRGLIVPELKQILGRRAQLRAWCAGCATGEEPYSLAILLHDAGLLPRSHVLGTDVSRVSLARARAARYGRWSFREAAPGFVARWFKQVDGVFALDDSIRRHVVFDHLNLAADPYPCPAKGIWGMDLIFCRNVMLYFDPETIKRVALHFYDSLRDGGWLMTGPSDPSLEGLAPFEVTHTSAGILYRRREARGKLPAPSSTRKPRRTVPPDAPAGVAARLPRRTRTVPPPPGSPALATPTTSPAAASGPDEQLARAREAYAHGDWAGAARLVAALPDSAEACVLHVRALANLGKPADAEAAAAQALAQHGLEVELIFLRALVLLTLKRDEDALECARRALYLDRSFVVGYFVLGEIQARLGHVRAAQVAYRRARDLCAALPAEAVVPFGDGHSASSLAEVAAAQLARLDLDLEESGA